MRLFFTSAAIISFSILAGCASDKLVQSTAAFGTATSNAVNSQQEELSIYRTSKLEEAKSLYASRQISIGISDTCVEALAAEKPNETIKLCNVIPREEIPDFVPVYEPTTIPKLATALKNYADALVLLSGDFKSDEEKLLVALTGIASNIKTLDLTLAEFNNDSGGELDNDRVDAIVALVATAANASFQIQRDKVLVDLLQESDPLVQETTKTLSLAMEEIKLLRNATTFQALNDAVAEHENARITVSGKKLRAINDTVFERLSEFKQAILISNPYPAIGTAHTQLVSASKSNFSIKENSRFIKTLISLVESSANLQDTL